MYWKGTTSNPKPEKNSVRSEVTFNQCPPSPRRWSVNLDANIIPEGTLEGEGRIVDIKYLQEAAYYGTGSSIGLVIP